MVSTGQEGTHGPTGAMGGGVAIFIAAITSVILLPLIWAESFASLIGVGVVLLAILVLAVAFLRVAFVYPEPIRHAADVRAEAEPRSLPLASFERIFAVSVLFYSTGAFWRVLQGSRDMESGTWTGALITNALWILVYLTAFWLLRRTCVVPWHLWKRGIVLLLPVPVAVVSLIWSQDRGLTFLCPCGVREVVKSVDRSGRGGAVHHHATRAPTKDPNPVGRIHRLARSDGAPQQVPQRQADGFTRVHLEVAFELSDEPLDAFRRFGYTRHQELDPGPIGAEHLDGRNGRVRGQGSVNHLLQTVGLDGCRHDIIRVGLERA